MYKLDKQYFQHGEWWLCTIENASYALLENVEKPKETIMVRQ